MKERKHKVSGAFYYKRRIAELEALVEIYENSLDTIVVEVSTIVSETGLWEDASDEG